MRTATRAGARVRPSPKRPASAGRRRAESDAPSAFPVLGYLIHITHYDGLWFKRKPWETPFDLDTGRAVVDALAEAGMNMLLIDVADGVKYKSHPELERHYTVPMKTLAALVKHARACGLEIVPKLNFSQSVRHRHQMWLQPHAAKFVFDHARPEAFKIASQLMDELIEVCRPERFFHIGMDEDHLRAYSQYISDIAVFRSLLKDRRLRTVIWNDSTHSGPAHIHAEKSLLAERELPKDIVHVLWNYQRVCPEAVKRITDRGLELWLAPGTAAKCVRPWVRAAHQYGAQGLVMTHWIPCRKANRARLLAAIRATAPLYQE